MTQKRLYELLGKRYWDKENNREYDKTDYDGEDYSIETLIKLVEEGAEIDDTCLLCACYNQLPKHVQYILDFKLLPEKRHFTALLKGIDDDSDDDDLEDIQSTMNLLIQYGYCPDKEDVIAAAQVGLEIPYISRFNITIDKDIWNAYLYGNIDIDRNPVIRRFIKAGYRPDKEDVITAARVGLEIPDISRFDIDVDKDVWDACLVGKIQPKYDFSKIEKTQELLTLYSMCDRRSAKRGRIKQHLEDNDLKIDKVALEKLCDHQGNYNLVSSHVTKDNITAEALYSYTMMYSCRWFFTDMAKCLVEKDKENKKKYESIRQKKVRLEKENKMLKERLEEMTEMYGH